MATTRTILPRSASALLLLAGVTCGGGVASQTETEQIATPPFIPLSESQHYIVRYMGITCGHMILESCLDEFEGRPAYHIVMTARNSRFFNKIYKVDGRIDSWVDVESTTTVAYESLIEEKGETSTKSYRVNSTEGTVLAVENGESQTTTFEPSAPVLDPLAFIFRLQAIAREPGESVNLTLLTTDGVLETMASVGELEKRRTTLGPRHLLEIRPKPADGQMFSRKGEVSLWIDPTDEGRLVILDFKLPFGHLTAKLD